MKYFILDGNFYELFFVGEKIVMLREKLNKFLILKDISLICYFLEILWEEVFEWIKRFYIRKV